MPAMSICLGAVLFFLQYYNLSSAIVSEISPHHESEKRFGTCDPDVPSRPLPEKFTLRVLIPTVTSCGAGEFLDTVTSQCQKCAEGYFMTAKMAASGQYTECEMCYKHDTINERVVTPCNSTRDAEILCTGGFYRHKTEDGKCYFECLACSLCGVGESLGLNYPTRPCVGYTDVKCCQHADDVVGEGGSCVRAESKLNSTQVQQLHKPIFPTEHEKMEPSSSRQLVNDQNTNGVSEPKPSVLFAGFLALPYLYYKLFVL